MAILRRHERSKPRIAPATRDSVLTSVRPGWTKSPASATGKATGSSHQNGYGEGLAMPLSATVTVASSPSLWNAKPNLPSWLNQKPNRPDRHENALHEDWLRTAAKSTPSLMTTAWSLPDTRQWRNPFCQIYFAHLYSSCERWLNENAKGLIRQYLPKSRRLDTVTQKELEHIMQRLNHRPRKSLGFKTPYELFCKKKTLLTVALAC